MARRTPDRRQRLYAVLGGVVAVLVLVAVTALAVTAVTATKTRDTQVTNTVKADQRDETLALIKSCTTPGQPCYERGQAQTAKAVGDIGAQNARAAAAAAFCSQQNANMTYELILECTNRRVATATTRDR